MKKEINYTLHAGKKIAERGINKSLIESAILSPDTVLKDKFDSVLIHAIKKADNKYIRVIYREINDYKVLVISAFFDRRLKRG